MYIEALKKIISDFVNMCGEHFNDDNTEAQSQITNLEKKIIDLESKEKLSTSEKTDLDILKIRKESWINSASYLGKKILDDFLEGNSQNEIMNNFNLLYDKVEKSKLDLHSLLVENNNDNILDAINKINISYIKDKAKIIDDQGKAYSNIYKHYEEKKSLNKNVIKTLNEKKIIVDETISLYQDIIKGMGNEINKNNEDLLSFNEKKYLMAYALLKEESYEEIDEEINKLREIKLLNETELKKFNSELEIILKEKETIEKNLEDKNNELESLEVELKEYKIKTENKEYVSKELEIDHNIDLLMEDIKLKKLNLQKDLLYVDFNKMKEMAISIINSPEKVNTLNAELEDEYTKEEINRIDDMMKKYDVTKEEAIQAVEITRRREKEDSLVKNYMQEFDLSEEEAEQAVRNESGNKFWTIEEEAE